MIAERDSSPDLCPVARATDRTRQMSESIEEVEDAKKKAASKAPPIERWGKT